MRFALETGELSYANPADHSHFSPIRNCCPIAIMARVREMQVGVDSRRLLGRRDSDWELSERRPILPSDVTHQTEVG